jgi:hypothetical protein
MKATALALALALGAQDEFGRWIEDLGSDRIDVRDNAARRLEKLGPDAIERIETAAARSSDLEVRARLQQIVRAIRKRVEFSKVFGETRRVTLDAKEQPIGQILDVLSKALGEKVHIDGLDPQKRVTMKLEGATLWEALERFERAADVTCECSKGNHEFYVRPGAPPTLPTLYLEQFRVGIVEAKRVEHRSPGFRDAVILLALEVRYQPNMQPIQDWSDKRFTIDEVKDAKGDDVRKEAPDWGNGFCLSGRAFALQQAVMASADAVGPLTVSGTARISFARDMKDLTVPIDSTQEIADGPFRLKVKAFNQSPAGTTMTLEARSTDGSDVKQRVEREEFYLIDEQGKKHKGDTRGAGGSGDDWSWDLEFPAGIPKPQKLVFRWIQEFKTVEIPFRFEGVALP